MKAVILAGGLGTRLRPVTYEIPKPLIPVRKKPIVNHLIELFVRHGITDIGILIGRHHEGDFARWYTAWKNELAPAKISIFYEEKPRGTFGGFEALREWLGDESFIVSNGDELKDFDLTAMRTFHEKHEPTGTIALFRVPNPQDYGVAVLDGPHIREFIEKPANPPSPYINSGLYVLEPEVFGYADFSQDVQMFEKDIFPKLAAERKLAGYAIDNGRWYDCGTLERWEKAMKEW